jgi:hypothetical protein
MQGNNVVTVALQGQTLAVAQAVAQRRYGGDLQAAVYYLVQRGCAEARRVARSHARTRVLSSIAKALASGVEISPTQALEMLQKALQGEEV